MAPKRIKAHRGQAYHLGVTCGACGAECEPNAANWADATPAQQRRIAEFIIHPKQEKGARRGSNRGPNEHKDRA